MSACGRNRIFPYPERGSVERSSPNPLASFHARRGRRLWLGIQAADVDLLSRRYRDRAWFRGAFVVSRATCRSCCTLGTAFTSRFGRPVMSKHLAVCSSAVERRFDKAARSRTDTGAHNGGQWTSRTQLRRRTLMSDATAAEAVIKGKMVPKNRLLFRPIMIWSPDRMGDAVHGAAGSERSR